MTLRNLSMVIALLGTTALAEDVKYSLNFDGANGVEDPLRFTADDIAAAFPNLRLVQFMADNSFGGGPRMMALLDGDTPMFIVDLAELESDYSFSIFTWSKDVAGPNGWRVGETVLMDVVGQAGWECGRGYNELAFRVVCVHWEEGMRLMFEEQPQISIETVGPEKYDPALGGAVLEEIRLFFEQASTVGRLD